MSNIKKISIIMPIGRDDTLIDDVIDGMINLVDTSRQIEFQVSSTASLREGIERYVLDRRSFVEFGKRADLVLLSYGKKGTDFGLAEEIGRWDRTMFIDGSEPGKNNRLDLDIQRQILNLEYQKYGAIDTTMLDKCGLYFRREQPYLKGITPLPFGINSSYIKYKTGHSKEIDFACIFGQDHRPPLRRFVREVLIDFCKKNGFSYAVNKTATSEEFYNILARAKVGVSVSGGGFDTLRFWEILGNNCLLMTERVDIFKLDSGELEYKRIYQFNNLYDFQYQLEKVGNFLRNGYNQIDLEPEYHAIMERHGSKTRTLTVLRESERAVGTSVQQRALCSILVSSYDNNDDLWDPFFTLLFRYWPDCPYSVYLMNNRKAYRHEGVTTLNVGGGTVWADNVLRALDEISTPYIMLFIEDFFLNRPVPTRHIKELVVFAQHEHTASIQIAPFPDDAPDADYPNDLNLGALSKQASYRTSLRTAIWDKEIFRQLLKAGETAWDMEVKGNERSKTINAPFLVAKQPVITMYSDAGVRRGKWVYGTKKMFRREGISVNYRKRPVDYRTRFEGIRDRLRKKKIAQFIRRIPFLGDILSWLYWKP